MRKLAVLCSVVTAFAVTNLSAATATQKKAFAAEKRATAVALAATKKAAAAINKANVLEAKATALLSTLPHGSTVKTPTEFVTARCGAALAKSNELSSWTTMTNEELAAAKAAWNLSEKAAIADEKAAFNALTPTEKAAYKASLAAAIALEAAGDATDDAISKALYANETFEQRVSDNDAQAEEAANLLALASQLSPAQFAAAKAAYYAGLYAEKEGFYLYCIGLTPLGRLDELANMTALDPDPATADDVVIADGARFE